MKWVDLESKSFNNAVKPFVTITVTLKHSYAETPGNAQIFRGYCRRGTSKLLGAKTTVQKVTKVPRSSFVCVITVISFWFKLK